MSTPISRSNKLEGLALYAPRRVREILSPDHESSPAAQEPESDWAEVPEEDDSLEGETDFAHDRLEQAIREAIELGRTSHDDAASDPRMPPAPPLKPLSSQTDRRPPGAEVLGPDRADAQIRRRRRSLDPEIVPEPQAAMPRNGAVGPLIRFSLVIIFAAMVAYGFTRFSSWGPTPGWLKGATDRVATAPRQPVQTPVADITPPSRLVVEDQQAFANEPLPFAVVVEHPREDESLLLSGLATGSRLSIGTPTGASSWQLSPNKLKGLYLYAPKDFVGVMNTAVALIGGDKRLLDSRAVQLKWIQKQTNPPPRAALASTTPLAIPGDQVGVAVPRPVASDPIDPNEAAFLMQQGRQSLSAGDISAARVDFRRLADAGVADAALELAETYDPIYLAHHNVIGLSGDRMTAKELYERARQLGSAEADRMLARMTRTVE